MGEGWRKGVSLRVYPSKTDVKDIEPNVQSTDIAYRMERPEAQRQREMLESLGILKQNEARKETVNHPDHYNSKGIEVIDVIRAFDLSFSLGNVVKYVTRAGKKHKETYLEDLKKAKWYLDEEIRYVEGIPQGILER
jgi:hypothetical protein